MAQIKQKKFISATPVKKGVNKKAIIVILSVVGFVIFGLLGGVIYYYVTYGTLPTLSDSSAGFISQVKDKIVKNKISTKCQTFRACTDGTVMNQKTCVCEKVVCNLNVKAKCTKNQTFDATNCKCIDIVKKQVSAQCSKKADSQYYSCAITYSIGNVATYVSTKDETSTVDNARINCVSTSSSLQLNVTDITVRSNLTKLGWTCIDVIY